MFFVITVKETQDFPMYAGLQLEILNCISYRGHIKCGNYKYDFFFTLW